MIKDMLRNGLKWVSYHSKKNKDIWVFGAWEGTLYSDNSKYLFEYVNAVDKSIRCIWISKEQSVVDQVRSLGYEAYHRASIKGIYYCLRAGAAFITADVSDLSMIIGGKTEIFQLWHGMGMKAVGYKSGWTKQQGLGLDNSDEEPLKKYSEWTWLCASEEAIQKYGSSFRIPREKFVITGEPKGDPFTNVPRSEYIEQLREQHPGARIAVYLPTHRNFGHDDTKSDMLSIETLKQVNEQLAAINALMIFKPHYHEFEKYKDYHGQLSNIIFGTDKAKFGDVYEFLPSCDMLITDYSGIMFGYLASGKPIIYFPYDKESYITGDAGFCYDYDDISYGPVCMTWKEVVEQIRSIKAEDYQVAREKQRKRFCPFSDGKSCERAYREARRRVS